MGNNFANHLHKNYFNTAVVSADLMDIATRYFNLALIVSAVSATLMLITMLFYNLSKKDHKLIMEELKAREVVDSATEVEAEQEGEALQAVRE